MSHSSAQQIICSTTKAKFNQKLNNFAVQSVCVCVWIPNAANARNGLKNDERKKKLNQKQALNKDDIRLRWCFAWFLIALPWWSGFESQRKGERSWSYFKCCSMLRLRAFRSWCYYCSPQLLPLIFPIGFGIVHQSQAHSPTKIGTQIKWNEKYVHKINARTRICNSVHLLGLNLSLEM